MKHLLFLCHRIPFPPNKGDKIRSFNMLKKLSEHYIVHLAAFVDDPEDWQYEANLKKYCESLSLVALNKKTATIKSATAFISNKPLTLSYFYNAQIAKFTRKILAAYEDADVFVFSSSMAQYVDNEKHKHLNRVIDFVDVDSDKWRQYSEKKSWPMSWVFRREAKLLEKEEVRLTARFDRSLFVSPQEASHFCDLVPENLREKVGFVLNGVDTKYFSPSFSKEMDESGPFLSFTGAMDYWANVDAVVWFVKNVWPQVLINHPNLRFYIVGGNPTEEVRALQQSKGVVVTGRVEDVRPFIKNAAICIAPMRIARGIQNKVLEAMAMAKPMVLTNMAADGITIPEEQEKYLADDAHSFCNGILNLLGSTQEQKLVGASNCAVIENNFKWKNTLTSLLDSFKTPENKNNIPGE